MSERKKVKNTWQGWIIFILLLPILILLAILYGIVLGIPWLISRFIRRPRLLKRVKKEWIPQGKDILFVYSDNPAWKEYVENNIIPKIASRAVILNWSDRKNWIHGGSLEAEIFKNYTYGREWIWQRNIRMGSQDYNHIAIVFKPWNRPRLFKFQKAFKDYEFGKEEKLKDIEKKLSNYINGQDS